jgi:hypothetical protein
MRVIIAAFVGGVIVFGLALAAWMFLPVVERGMDRLDDAQEEALGKAIRENVERPGCYMLPSMDRQRFADDTEYREVLLPRRHKDGPAAMLLVSPHGNDPTRPLPFLRDGAISFGMALLASVLLAMASLRRYLARVFFVLLLGTFAGAVAYLPSWNWLDLPVNYAVVMCATEAGIWLAAGLFIAAIVRPKRLKVEA